MGFVPVETILADPPGYQYKFIVSDLLKYAKC